MATGTPLVSGRLGMRPWRRQHLQPDSR